MFGRKLGRSDGSRGPPGVGYKITEDGQYDVDNKRICNLAAPNQLKDAVNLDTLQRLIRSEVQGVIDVISRMRSEIDNLNIMVEAHRDELDNSLLKLDSKVKDIEANIYEKISDGK